VKRTNILGSLEKTSLHSASVEGNIEDVWLLLDEGPEVNEPDTVHKTVLHVASRQGHRKSQIAETSLAGPVDHDESSFGHRVIAELLLDHGADVNARTRKQDLFSPLHLASWNGHLEIVSLLLGRGADIHARGINGRSSYRLALKTGQRDIIRVVLRATDVAQAVRIHFLYTLHSSHAAINVCFVGN
jgi:ankyrin repeat protein